MKKYISGMLLLSIVFVLLATGCVSRTISTQPQIRGPQSAEGKKSFGASADEKIIEKKIIWIWQPEFWNKTVEL